MSKFVKCDRCKTDTKAVKDLGIDVKPTDWKTILEKDLCGDCCEELKKFLDGHLVRG